MKYIFICLLFSFPFIALGQADTGKVKNDTILKSDTIVKKGTTVKPKYVHKKRVSDEPLYFAPFMDSALTEDEAKILYPALRDCNVFKINFRCKACKETTSELQKKFNESDSLRNFR